MIDVAVLPVFLAGALVLNLTPGPDVAFVMASALKGGLRTGIAAAFGVGAGCLFWAALAAGGVAALLAASNEALLILRLAGGFYLLALAARTIETLDDPPALAAKGAGSAARAFRQGAFTNLLNPKVGIFFIAFLPGFAVSEAAPVSLQALALGAIFSVTGTLVLIAYAAAAGALRARFERSRSLRQAFGALAASAFGALGLRLLTARAG